MLSINLIVLHAVLVIIGQSMYEHAKNPDFGALNIVELILIVLMIFEFLISFSVFQMSFLTFWNLFDFIMLVCLISLYIADAVVGNFYASSVFKLRALCRMYKVTLHILYIASPPFSSIGSKVSNQSDSKLKSRGEEVTEILEGMKRRAKRQSIIAVDTN